MCYQYVLYQGTDGDSSHRQAVADRMSSRNTVSMDTFTTPDHYTCSSSKQDFSWTQQSSKYTRPNSSNKESRYMPTSHLAINIYPSLSCLKKMHAFLALICSRAKKQLPYYDSSEEFTLYLHIEDARTSTCKIYLLIVPLFRN